MLNLNSELTDHMALEVKPAFNVLPMLDMLNGVWVVGDNGDDILVGGLQHHTGIAAMANTGKTALGLLMFVTALNRHRFATGHVLETEGTLWEDRIEKASRDRRSGDPFVVDNDRVMMLDGENLALDEWFDKMCAFTDIRLQLRKKQPKKCLTTPFKLSDARGNKMLPPVFSFIDSWSEAQISSADTKTMKAGVDAKEGNTEYMREGLIKGKVAAKLARLMINGDMFVLHTASLDDLGPDMNSTMPGVPRPKSMSQLSNKVGLKNVGRQYKKRTSNIWTFGIPQQLNKGTARADKIPKYPLDKSDLVVGNGDLEFVDFFNIRGKSGPSGGAYTLIRSQRAGILIDESHLVFCRDWGKTAEGNDDYGISPAGAHIYEFDLMPGVKWRNTNIRPMFLESDKLGKVVEFTMALKMMFKNLRDDRLMKYEITPKELYNKMIELGYCWDKLLDTRSYWLFKEEEKFDKPYLSILMLVKTAAGERTLDWCKK